MELSALTTFNLAILVLAIGKVLNLKISILRRFNIPEPVTGGLLFCIFSVILYAGFGLALSFDLAARDFLLLYFFAGIGLNSDFRSLMAGGIPLLILLAATIAYMILQNLTGIGAATLLGQNPVVGVLGGTASLIGGHGTAIAWAPTFESEYGITSAMEIGVACATFGLVLSSLMGGPIARYLINKHDLKSSDTETLDVGVSHEEEGTSINSSTMLGSLLVLNVSLSIGLAMNEALQAAGVQLPLFVTCLFGGIILTNTVPRLLPKLKWPSQSRSLAIISDISLSVFLAMSLMSLQLWTLADVAGPVLGIVGAQFVVAVLFTLFVIYRVMGRNYEAAVVCAGFGGISLGATPTAMANMTAVSKRYGPAHKAFIIVPLVCGFFVDIVNAILIKFFLGWVG